LQIYCLYYLYKNLKSGYIITFVDESFSIGHYKVLIVQFQVFIKKVTSIQQG